MVNLASLRGAATEIRHAENCLSARWRKPSFVQRGFNASNRR